jgi:acetyl esterase/lipase
MSTVSKHALVVLGLASLTAAGCGEGPHGPEGKHALLEDELVEEIGCGKAVAGTITDVAYAQVPGIDPSYLSLDVYTPKGTKTCDAKPLVVWVHGGAWALGDKAGNGIEEKIALFRSLGYIFASVNYRLSPAPSHASQAKFPDHPTDVANAIGFLLRRAARYGIHAKKVALLGHSAGAHLSALVGSDPRYLEQANPNGPEKPLAALRCVGSYDTEAYDIPYTLASAGPALVAIYTNAFGAAPAVLRAASPYEYVSGSTSMPTFQFASRGNAARRQQLQRHVDRLKNAGVSTTTIEAGSLDHEAVNTRIGAPGDAVMTPAVTAFLQKCFATPITPPARLTAGT